MLVMTDIKSIKYTVLNAINQIWACKYTISSAIYQKHFFGLSCMHFVFQLRFKIISISMDDVIAWCNCMNNQLNQTTNKKSIKSNN